MNVPKRALAAVLDHLPALSSPTIWPLAATHTTHARSSVVNKLGCAGCRHKRVDPKAPQAWSEGNYYHGRLLGGSILAGLLGPRARCSFNSQQSL